MRDSFVFYSSFEAAANMLGDKARLKLYDAVVKLGLCCAENVTELEQVCAEIETNLAQNRNAFAQFLLIKPQIIANFTRYLNGSKGAKYGGLGGAPVGNKNAAKNNPKTTPNENVNVNENNIIKENIKEKSKTFIKPKIEEIETYCREKNLSVNPQAFFDYFEAGNWTDSNGNKVKNWKQKILTWQSHQKPAPASRKTADDDAEWWAQLEKRVAENDYE
jgi:hypothetical protein